jgi:hypothetical protein
VLCGTQLNINLKSKVLRLLSTRRSHITVDVISVK